MKRKGDSLGECCERKSWSGPEGGCGLPGAAPLSTNHRKWLRGCGGLCLCHCGHSVLLCVSPGGPHLTVSAPQRCCGHCHQPLYAPPWGPDQEWGQEVGEELLPEKGAEVKSGPVLSKNPPGYLQSFSALYHFRNDSLPFRHFPSGDGESEVR